MFVLVMLQVFSLRSQFHSEL